MLIRSQAIAADATQIQSGGRSFKEVDRTPMKGCYCTRLLSDPVDNCCTEMASRMTSPSVKTVQVSRMPRLRFWSS